MTDEKQAIDAAVEQFRSLMESQLARAKRIREDKDFTDFDALDTIVIGICGGDGIGPVITKESERVLSFLLKDEVASGKIRGAEMRFEAPLPPYFTSFLHTCREKKR